MISHWHFNCVFMTVSECRSFIIVVDHLDLLFYDTCLF